MTGNLIELPRKLEWKLVETWVGKVRGTMLWTKAEAKTDGSGFVWSAWNGPILVNNGEAPSLPQARKLAEEALETGVLVVRPLPQRQGT